MRIALIWSLFIAALCTTLHATDTKEIVKVGVILPLSGDNSDFGKPIQELLNYKFSHLPKNSHLEYKLFFEDDQLVAKNALLAAHRLIDLENVDVLITMFSASGSVVAPLAAQKKVPQLMLNMNEAAADGHFNFICITPVDESAKLWHKYATEKGYRKVAFFIHRNTGGEMVLKALQKTKEGSEIDWVACERFNPGEIDFRVALMKLKETHPDALFLFGFNPEQPIIVHQLKQMGWDIPICSIGNTEMDMKDPLFEDIWFAGVNAPTIKFIKWYEENLHKSYPPWGATYSCISDLIYKSFEDGWNGKKPTHEQVSKNLLGVKDFDSDCGRISCDTKGIFRTTPVLMVVKHGSIEPIK
jgi:branched-chain amino acid transport system substrate-binding protein